MATAKQAQERIRSAVYHIVRAYLEVERGLRPPEHLVPFLTDAEYRRHRRNPPHSRFPMAGPVVPTDVGHIALDFHQPRQITATIPTRESGDTWGAIVLHLVQGPEGWRADQLKRLGRRIPPRRRVVEPSDPADIGQRIQQVRKDHALVAAARRAIQARLADHAGAARGTERDGDADESRDALRDRKRTLDRFDRYLTQELNELTRTRELRRSLSERSLDRAPQRTRDRVSRERQGSPRRDAISGRRVRPGDVGLEI